MKNNRIFKKRTNRAIGSTQWRSGFQSRNYKALYLGLAGLIVVSSLGKLILANHLATAGEEITHLEERATQLDSGSHTLRNEIAKHSSLRIVLENALELGMVNDGGRIDTLAPASLASR